jgi:hypothetical protein
LHRDPLTLGGGARSAQEARRWVAGLCRDLDRPELVDAAELAVSELVTNAVLHGAPPIRVSAGGTAEHPRIEVHDGSPVPPRPPDPAPAPAPVVDLDSFDLDAFDPDGLELDLSALTSFGRGLALVARASVAWGADVSADGKTVWFEPAAELADEGGADFRLCELAPAPEPESADQLTVVLRAAPAPALAGFHRHFGALQREVRLLALAHEADYPLAATLAQHFAVLDAPLRSSLAQVDAARARGAVVTDLEVRVSTATAREIGALGRLLDAADEFCRSQRLLTLARDDDQRRFQTWFVGEFARQLDGAAPRAWDDPGAASTIVG